jgi:NAD(P)-dependent dehydrogenase (short-subunit alcohol dehydrogenase family)
VGRLDGKVIIVTGAAGGLGREYSVQMAEEGAKLTVVDVQDCAETVERIQAVGGEALPLVVDVSSEEQTKEMARRTFEKYGRMDGLLNNAAIMRGLAVRSLMDVDMDVWDRVYAVNARGTFLGIRAVFPYMKEQQGGTIVNVSSGSTLRIARAADDLNPHYVSSKSAIVGITRGVARELGAHNINVVTMAPGSTTSDRDEALTSDEAFDEPEASLLRRGVPSDLTGVMAFLFSDDARFISGQMITVNGGREVH